MSCDDMYVCENGTCLFSCRIKIKMGKCDKFSTIEEYEKFMKEKHKLCPRYQK
jgi:hypothetical protein